MLTRSGVDDLVLYFPPLGVSRSVWHDRCVFGSPPTDDSPRRRSPFAPRMPASQAKPAPIPPVAPPQRERNGRRGRAPAEARAEADEAARPVTGHPGAAARGAHHRRVLRAARGRSHHGRADVRRPAQRLPFAIVVLGAQLLYVFATTMALRPPDGQGRGRGRCDRCASSPTSRPTSPRPPPSCRSALSRRAVSCSGARPAGDQARAGCGSPSRFGSTLVIVLGIIFFASLLVLVRFPLGTQTIVVCLASCGVALSVARLADVVDALSAACRPGAARRGGRRAAAP